MTSPLLVQLLSLKERATWDLRWRESERERERENEREREREREREGGRERVSGF